MPALIILLLNLAVTIAAKSLEKLLPDIISRYWSRGHRVKHKVIAKINIMKITRKSTIKEIADAGKEV